MKTSSPLQGVAYLFTGIQLITQPKLRQFVLMPLVFSATLFALGTWYAISKVQALATSINAMLPSWLQWMEWLFIPLFFAVAGITLFWSLGVIANLLGSPFNALLAQKVEYHLTGQFSAENPLAANNIWQNILPPIRSEIGKIIYFIVRAIPLLILFLIPLINFIAPLLWLLFSCWMMGFQYADIPMGNHHLNGNQVLAKLKEKRLLTLGFGAATLLMTLIPIINFLAMPAAVAGATAMWVKEWKN